MKCISPTRFVRISLCVIFIVAAALRLYDAKSFWYDEFFSISMARASWPVFWHIVKVKEANMVLYYLLLHFWIKLGANELSIRLISVLFGLLSILAIFFLGRKMFGALAGLLAAAMLSVNAFHIMYSQEVRGYSMLALVSVISTLTFVRAVKDHSPKYWVLYAVITGISLYVHVFAVLVPISHFFSLLFTYRRVPSKSLVLPGVVGALIALPMLAYIVVHRHGSQIGWAPRVGIGQLWSMFRMLSGDGGNLLAVAFLFCILLSVVGAVRTSDKWDYLVCWCSFLVPIGLTFIVSVRKPMFVPRFLLCSLMPMTILAAVGIARLPLIWRTTAVIAMATIAIWPLPAYYRWRGYNDWRSLAEFVSSNATAEDVVTFRQPILVPDFRYYSHCLARVDVPYQVSDAELWIIPWISRGDLSKYPDFVGRLRNHDRVWLIEMDEPETSDKKIPFFFGTKEPWHQGPMQRTTKLAPAVINDPLTTRLSQFFPERYEKRFPGLRVVIFSRH